MLGYQELKFAKTWKRVFRGGVLDMGCFLQGERHFIGGGSNRYKFPRGENNSISKVHLQHLYSSVSMVKIQ